MEKSKLIKITFEYEDETSILEGDICNEWLETINGVLSEMQVRRGRKFSVLEKCEWKTYTKKEIRKEKLEKLNELKSR